MSPDSDIEAGPTQDNGRKDYDTAAKWLVRDTDGESLVFRKFNKLAALNLLYLQSEVLEIEQKIDRMHEDVARSGELNLMTTTRVWEALAELVEQSAGVDPALQAKARSQMELVRHLRAVIKEYHEALILQTQIEQLQRPEERVMEPLEHFFRGPNPVLLGKADGYLKDRSDLVALKSPSEIDHLSKFLRWHLAEQKETASDGSTYKHFKESTVTKIVNIVTVVLAAVFLFGSIIGFYFVQTPIPKLVMIAVFTTCFATSLGLITSAKRAEIFGATAAYAAVLVVFVSSGSLQESST